MANHLAVAQVSAAFRSRLIGAWQEARPSPGGPVNVTVGIPPVSQDAAPARINIHLFRVAPDLANANADLPTRGSADTLLKVPAAAIELSYLFTFHGAADGLLVHRLIGLTLDHLHARPWLSVEDLAAATADAGSGVANLADEGRRLMLTPLNLTADELSRMWTMLPVGSYAPSLAWTVAGIRLEPVDQAAMPARPVRELALDVEPSAAMPSVSAIRPADPDEAEIVAGAAVLIDGTGLDARTRLLLDGEPISAVVTDDGMRLDLPGSTRPGSHVLRAVRAAGPPAPGSLLMGGPALAFVVSPVLSSPPQASTATAEDVRVTTVQLTVSSPVGPDQQVALVLVPDPDDGRPPVRLTDVAPRAAPGQELLVTGREIATGTYLAVVEIDGVSSPLTMSTPGGRYDGPALVVP